MTEKEFDPEVLITGYEPGAVFLTEHGYPLSKSYLSKICAPSVSQGPEVEGYWNGRPMFRPSALLAWARQRIKPSKTPPTTAASSTQATDPPATTADPPARRGRGRPRKPRASPPVPAAVPKRPAIAEMLPPVTDSPPTAPTETPPTVGDR